MWFDLNNDFNPNFLPNLTTMTFLKIKQRLANLRGKLEVNGKQIKECLHPVMHTYVQAHAQADGQPANILSQAPSTG